MVLSQEELDLIIEALKFVGDLYSKSVTSDKAKKCYNLANKLKLREQLKVLGVA